MLKTISIALIFLFLGLLTSPTLISLYSIIIIIPAIILTIKTWPLNLSRSSIALLLLTAWGALSFVINYPEIQDKIKSFQELLYYFYAVLFLTPIAYYFKNSSQHKTKRLLNILLYTIIAAYFIGISKAWFHFDIIKWQSGDFHTRSGGFSNYMRYGYASALMLLLSIGAFINHKKIETIVSKNWLIVFMVFNFLAILAAQTRGAVLGLIMALPFLFWRYRPKLARYMLALGFVAIIGIGTYSLLTKSANRYANINDGSNKMRLSQFLTAAYAIKDNPILGLGPDQFSYNVPRLKEKYDIWSKEYAAHAHNIFLEHAANFGVVGLLFFIAFFVLWFIEMWKLQNDFGHVICSFIIAFVISGQVEVLFDVINTHLLFFIYGFSQFKTTKINI